MMMMMTVMVMTRDNLEQLLIGSLGAEGVGSLLGLARPLTMLPALYPSPPTPPSQAKSHNTSGRSAFLPQQPFNAFTFGCAACFPLPTLGLAKLPLAYESEAQSHPSEVAWGAAVWEEGPPSV